MDLSDLKIIKTEICPKEYWLKNCTFEEAVLYCFRLDIDGKKGWVMPYRNDLSLGSNIFVLAVGGIWFHENKDTLYTMTCVPVRKV